MYNKKDLIKEAIADAKAVREVALTNAKLALQEAFEPRLKNIMSAHLEEELNEGEEDEETKQMSEDELEEMMKRDDEETSMEEEIDINQLLAELEEASKDQDDEMPLEEAKEEEEEEEEEKEEEEEEEEEEIDLGDMTKEDLVDLIKDVISQEMEGDTMEDQMAADEMGADDIMMEEEEEEEEEGKEHMYNMKELEEAKKAKLRMKEKYNKDLKESLQTITLLKNELNEVNLLNAKLLYANKLFNKYSLSEGQKLKVINSFDNAETVRETKLVFNTLNESFESENKVKKEKTKSITEGLGIASKPVGSVKKPAGMLNESNDFVSRLQKLANIKF